MLTSLGKKTAVASAALYGMAYTLGYPELVVPAVVGGLSLATAVVTVARRPRIGATVDVTPTRVGRGQQVRVTAVLRNDGRWRSPRFTLRLPFGHNSTETAIRPLARRETREIALTLRLERRGLVEIGPLTVRQRDAFGLCRRVRTVAAPVKVHVHPMVHPVALPLTAKPRQAEGQPSPRAPRGGVAFHSLREYVPGDDLRHVHWRTSAKATAGSGNLFVRQHVDPDEAQSAVLLDTRGAVYADGRSGADDAFEVAVDFAASVLVASARRGVPVRLYTSGGTKGSGEPSRNGVKRILDALARVQLDPDGDLTAATNSLAAGRRVFQPGSATLTVITGASDGGTGPAVRHLLTSYERVIIARMGDTAAQSPARADGTRTVARSRLLTFYSATAAQAADAWGRIVSPPQRRR